MQRIDITTAQFNAQGADYDGNDRRSPPGQNFNWNTGDRLLYLKVEFLRSDHDGGEISILLDGLNGSLIKTISKNDPVYEVQTIGTVPFKNDFALKFNDIRSEVSMTWWRLS